MAIFKKSAVQGSFIFSDGTQALFDAEGYYETEKEAEISQLAEVYEQVEAREEVKQEAKPEVKTATVGAKSSATIAALAK